MKCNEFNRHIERLFDADTPLSQRREMETHMQSCPECAECYRRSRAALDAATPRCEVRAPASLKERIMREARTQERPAPSFRLGWLRPLSAAVAAAAVVALILFNPIESQRALAAGKLFREAAAALDRTQAFYMEMEVRTVPQDNFALIDADAPFTLHRMWVAPGNRWRLEKEGRIALSDGQRILLWQPATHSGSILPLESGTLEGFGELVDLPSLLLREEARAESRRGTTYKKEVGDRTITLTVEAPAEGDFTNDAMRNTSVTESDNRRTYVFDRATGRLESLKIEIRPKKKYVTVAELKRIDYDPQIGDGLFAQPQGIDWVDLRGGVGGSRLAGISAEEAVRQIFRATEHWNEALLKEAFVYYPLEVLKSRFEGSRLIEMQKPFRSGQYPGVFVRCRIRTADGKKEKLQLALRNDNAQGAWVVDGGI